jgi:hypothetical protein
MLLFLYLYPLPHFRHRNNNLIRRSCSRSHRSSNQVTKERNNTSHNPRSTSDKSLERISVYIHSNIARALNTELEKAGALCPQKPLAGIHVYCIPKIGDFPLQSFDSSHKLLRIRGTSHYLHLKKNKFGMIGRPGTNSFSSLGIACLFEKQLASHGARTPPFRVDHDSPMTEETAEQ